MVGPKNTTRSGCPPLLVPKMTADGETVGGGWAVVGGSPLVPSIRCSLGFSDQLGVGPVVSPTRVEGWGSGRFRHDKIPLCASQTPGGINDVRDKANYYLQIVFSDRGHFNCHIYLLNYSFQRLQ